MQIYFRDGFVEDAQPLISINDRSFRFGDGIFETAMIYNGKVNDWPRHAKRFQDGVDFFKFKIDLQQIPKLAEELIAKNNIKEGFLRAIISRGNSQVIGYKPMNTSPYLTLQTISHTLPVYQTIDMFLSTVRSFYNYPCKTNNALHYTMALLEAEENGCHNAVLLSPKAYIAESATGNLFWIKGNTLYTPSKDLPMVPGTVRDRVWELWDGEKQEGRFGIDELRSADEIFNTNIGWLITAVSEIKPLGIKSKTHEKTAKLREKLVKAITG